MMGATALNFWLETMVEMLLCLPRVKRECNNLECLEKIGSSAKSSTITKNGKEVGVLLFLHVQNHFALCRNYIFQILGVIVVKVKFLTNTLLHLHYILLVFDDRLPSLIHINGGAEDIDSFKTPPVHL